MYLSYETYLDVAKVVLGVPKLIPPPDEPPNPPNAGVVVVTGVNAPAPNENPDDGAGAAVVCDDPKVSDDVVVGVEVCPPPNENPDPKDGVDADVVTAVVAGLPNENPEVEPLAPVPKEKPRNLIN
jgi:hypothetical protein